MKKRKVKNKRLSKNIANFVWGMAIGEILIGIFLVLYMEPNITSNLKDMIVLATTKKPETFTELYFEDHLSLPNKIVYYEKNKFKFTIRNLENKDMNYSYEVYIDLNGEKQIIDEGSFFVKSGDYKTIYEDYTITHPTARVKVVVNLINKNQKIDFWIEGT